MDNCRNCGAPHNGKCNYCGTDYNTTIASKVVNNKQLDKKVHLALIIALIVFPASGLFLIKKF